MFPKQRIPKSEKTSAWKKDCIRYFGGNRAFSRNRNAEIIRQCEIAAGVVDFTTYNNIENPYNLRGDQYRKYPAKLKRFHIISPMFLRVRSDFDKRPFEPIVYTKNSNFENERQDYQKSLIMESLQSKFVNFMVKSGQVGSEQEVEEQSPEVIERMVSSMKDLETIESQHVLDYIIDKQDYQKKYSDEFYRFFATNIVVTFKDVRHDEVIKHSIHPANFQWTGNENLEFFEDANIVKCQWSMTFEDVVNIFQEQFEQDGYKGALDDLERTWNQSSGNATDNGFFNTYWKNRYGSDYVANGNITTKQILVDHIQWTSFRKVFIIGYDEQQSPIIVDEDWTGNYLESRWQEEIREGYIVAGKYYLGGDCIDYPVYDANDPFRAKKNYTGIVFMNDIIQQITIPDKLEQFQEAYDVIKWKLQYTINKNKDKLAVVPIGLLKNTFKPDSYTSDRIGDDIVSPELDLIDNEGNRFSQAQQAETDTKTKTDIENPIAQALYFADTTQMLFVDESSEEAVLAAQMIKTLDLSLGNFIEFLMQILTSIKAEAEDVIGFNRFTTGDYDQKDPVRNVQQGLKQSSAIIELYYAFFEWYVQNDLQGTIDRSVYAYKEGRSLTFIRNNAEIISNTLSDKFAKSSKGIFIKNSQKTQDILNTMKQESTSMLQNGMKHSTWMKMISSSNNYASIIQTVEDAENEMAQQQQQTAEAQQQHETQIQEMINADKQAERDLKKYIADLNASVAIDKNIATLEAFALNSKDADGGSGDVLKLEEIRTKQLADLNATQRQLAQLTVNKQIADDKNDTERYRADKDYQIAKENKPAKTSK